MDSLAVPERIDNLSNVMTSRSDEILQLLCSTAFGQPVFDFSIQMVPDDRCAVKSFYVSFCRVPVKDESEAASLIFTSLLTFYILLAFCLCHRMQQCSDASWILDACHEQHVRNSSRSAGLHSQENIKRLSTSVVLAQRAHATTMYFPLHKSGPYIKPHLQ
jgi:hypothetical protein